MAEKENAMSQVLKCKPNVLEEIALKFPDGINVFVSMGTRFSIPC